MLFGVGGAPFDEEEGQDVVIGTLAIPVDGGAHDVDSLRDVVGASEGFAEAHASVGEGGVAFGMFGHCDGFAQDGNGAGGLALKDEDVAEFTHGLGGDGGGLLILKAPFGDVGEAELGGDAVIGIAGFPAVGEDLFDVGGFVFERASAENSGTGEEDIGGGFEVAAGAEDGFGLGEFGGGAGLLVFAGEQEREAEAGGGGCRIFGDDGFEGLERLVCLAGLIEGAAEAELGVETVRAGGGIDEISVVVGGGGEVAHDDGAGGVEGLAFDAAETPAAIGGGGGIENGVAGFIDLVGFGVGDGEEGPGVDEVGVGGGDGFEEAGGTEGSGFGEGFLGLLIAVAGGGGGLVVAGGEGPGEPTGEEDGRGGGGPEDLGAAEGEGEGGGGAAVDDDYGGIVCATPGCGGEFGEVGWDLGAVVCGAAAGPAEAGGAGAGGGQAGAGVRGVGAGGLPAGTNGAGGAAVWGRREGESG